MKPTRAGTATDHATTVSLRTGVLPAQSQPAAAFGATAALLALIVLSIAWEGWLAPLRPGGSALVLKAVPLLLALPGVWRRRLYTLQWASMLILLYFAEGVVRGWSDHGLSARLGWLQAALAVIFFICTLTYVAPFKRAAKRAAKQAAADAATQATTHEASQVGTHTATQAATHSVTRAATQAATPAATDADQPANPNA